jgi:hypothetical protein
MFPLFLTLAMKQGTTVCLLNGGFLLVLPFTPEDEADMFLCKVGLLSLHYTTLCLRR